MLHTLNLHSAVCQLYLINWKEKEFTKSDIRHTSGILIYFSLLWKPLFNSCLFNKKQGGKRKKRRKLKYISIFYFRHRVCGRLKMATGGLPWWRSGWESACQCRGRGFEPWSGRIPHAAEQLGP